MKTQLFANVDLENRRGVAALNIAGITSIKVSAVDSYTAFSMPGYEKGCLKEVLITTSTGATVALYLMAETADKLEFENFKELDLEAEVGELRCEPLPSIGEVVEKLVDIAEGVAPAPDSSLDEEEPATEASTRILH